jgi:hypothetical protein
MDRRENVNLPFSGSGRLFIIILGQNNALFAIYGFICFLKMLFKKDGTKIPQQRAAAERDRGRTHLEDARRSVPKGVVGDLAVLGAGPRLEAKPPDHLQRRYRGKFSKGQLRSLQRGVRR